MVAVWPLRGHEAHQPVTNMRPAAGIDPVSGLAFADTEVRNDQ
jgi:hypothetical protein